MDTYPHHYKVQAAAKTEGSVALASERLPKLSSAPPLQFGGPGDQWSPETLLVAAAVVIAAVLSIHWMLRTPRRLVSPRRVPGT